MGKTQIFFAMLILLSSLASAEMIIGKAVCSDGLEFVIENTGTYDFRPKDFTIIGTNLWNKDRVKFEGTWKNLGNDIKERTTGQKFMSNNSVPSYGSYMINVTRVTQIDTQLVNGSSKVTSRESQTFKVECEELPFECNKVDISIDECYTVDDRYYGIISGTGNQKNFTPARFNFKFVGRGHIYENLTPDDTSFGEVAPGKYFVSFKAPSFTDWTTVNINGCDYARYPLTFDKTTCKLTKQCLSDNECADYEVCDTNAGGFCKVKLCGECEIAKNHACTPKCADNDACTADACNRGVCEHVKIPTCCYSDKDCGEATVCKTQTCIENKCAVKEKECKDTDDPCVVGRCEDAKGCVYSVNPQCQASLLQRFINWFIAFFR